MSTTSSLWKSTSLTTQPHDDSDIWGECLLMQLERVAQDLDFVKFQFLVCIRIVGCVLADIGRVLLIQLSVRKVVDKKSTRWSHYCLVQLVSSYSDIHFVSYKCLFTIFEVWESD